MKFLKSEWADSFLDGGVFFNPSYKFCISSEYSKGQFDPYDSFVHIHAKHLCMAPIIGEDSSGIVYGKGMEVAKKGDVHIQDNRISNIPITCFRIVEPNEIKRNVFKLDPRTLKRIKLDFPDYDAFILVAYPEVYIQRISQVFPLFSSQVFYGFSNSEIPKLDTVNNTPESFRSFCMQMFNKTPEYKYQKEYRIILPTQRWKEGRKLQIGTIRDIAFSASIDRLSKGFLISEFEEDSMRNSLFQEILG